MKNETKHLIRCTLLSALAALWTAELVRAHGTPIQLGAPASKLEVGGGFGDTNGFAGQIFLEVSEDGHGEVAPGPIPGVGNAVLWELPGLFISGLDSASSLSMEVLARSARCCGANEAHTVWYWNSDDGVAVAESPLYLLGNGLRQQAITPEDTTSLPPFLLTDAVGGTASQGGEQGFHNHGLVTYALDNNAPPAIGVYGFFARLTSDLYEPSDPMLIVLNYGVDESLVTEAALAINWAAGEPLAGDFNNDCVVDAADYVVWRGGPGGQDEYEAWRSNFGDALVFEAPGGGSVAAPEPGGLLIVVVSPVLATVGSRMRQTSVAGYGPRRWARARRLASSSREV